ncbi:MarR family transcriptional regulator [Saccharothrix violaceirubra]|uniref:DNA-binding MarR family transcriptional regulator n=1 Tax=Saccharothrix violaceirubra TaxID=413306 RepID=A0A7W7WW52_9PSEU|nr:MarR family transcriptional regulator [Saccharothrix violaceirubra]MBB4965746.1 DNA-binding MarR family transcriptional regulator [Saccharothrix violaceirubra]
MTTQRDLDRADWHRLHALHDRVEAALERSLQRRFRFGLSEFGALCALAASPTGELRMQDLTDTVGLNQSSVSRLVARLEQAGLCTRVLCETDRRGVYTVITDEGRRVHDQAAPVHDDTLAEIYLKLTEDPDLGPVLDAVRSASTTSAR